MIKDEKGNKGREVYNLAAECKVAVHAACRRIRMATSTPHRWLTEGSEPAPGSYERLRASILRVADKRGTLPEKYRAEFDALGEEADAPRNPLEIARDIKRNAMELERALAGG